MTRVMDIRVCIVEDDSRLRKNLGLLLDDGSGVCCSGTFGTAEEALKFIPQQPPDVVLMDIQLPGMSGVHCVRQLKALLPRLQVVMLTVYEDSDQVFDALKAGANGYLLKRSTPDQIVGAIREVYGGGAPMSSHIARMVVQSFESRGLHDRNSQTLTSREKQTLDYVAQGFVNKEIADALAISTETVRTHLKNIYEKLHVRSRTEAVSKCFHSVDRPRA